MSHQAEIIKKIREHYPFLSKEFGVKRIGIFGSVARHEEGSRLVILILSLSLVSRLVSNLLVLLNI